MLQTLSPPPAALDLEAANEQLLSFDAAGRVRWAVETFGDAAVLLSSMQKTASTLIHLLYTLGADNEVLFGDTNYHFQETLQLRDKLVRKYRANVVTLYPAETPEQQETRFGKKLYLFQDGQPECCRLRKEEPFLTYCRDHGKRLVMNGTRREEGGRRNRMRMLLPDPRIKGFVLHPLFDWSEADVDQYLADNGVPVHPLHAQDYPSIGCQCCTTPVQPGEEARAGRWRHLRQVEGEKIYCGINFHDGSGI